jgi:hypothetical protein
MSKQKKIIDIVTASKPLKKMLKMRIKEELGLSYGKIIANAKEDGISGLNKSNLSLYFGNDKPMSGSISQKSLLYLCVRYGINVGIKASFFRYNEKLMKEKVKRTFSE